MVKVNYNWKDGVPLKDHTKKKLEILKKYFRQYLIIRCKLPQQTKFRLAIVDGFSGGGKYKCGAYGSPLVFLETLANTIEEINITRSNQKMQEIEIECFIILNDTDKEAYEILKENIAPLHAGIKENTPKLHIKIELYNKKFNDLYPLIKKSLSDKKYGNVLFNLDQCGHSKVDTEVIKDIMQHWKSAEVFFTFLIEPFLKFISPDTNKDSVLLKHPDMRKNISNILNDWNNSISTEKWLGEVENVVYETFKSYSPYLSPFSIHNPNGWRYWLMHFANAPKARQVYNDVLHSCDSTQAHYGRAGLHMHSYNPNDDTQLYLFDEPGRASSKNELHDDIPRLIFEYGNAIVMEDFYKVAYSSTPAHSDDIHEVMIENPDIEVITEKGEKRRKASRIKKTDILKLKKQISMFSMFSNNTKEK